MYTFDSRVRYSEVDETGHLSTTGIINYMQDCSTFQSEDLGLGIDYLKNRNRAWWLSSWQIVISRCPELGERITVGTWPYEFKGFYGYRNFMIQDQQGDYLVKANSVWFYFDIRAGKPVRVQEEDIRGYGAGEHPKLQMEYAAKKIILPEHMEALEPITVGKHHIDTNQHVNNAQYVEIARELLSESLTIRELQVEYKQAAVLGDEIHPYVYHGRDQSILSLCNVKKQVFANILLKTGN